MISPEMMMMTVIMIINMMAALESFTIINSMIIIINVMMTDMDGPLAYGSPLWPSQNGHCWQHYWRRQTNPKCDNKKNRTIPRHWVGFVWKRGHLDVWPSFCMGALPVWGPASRPMSKMGGDTAAIWTHRHHILLSHIPAQTVQILVKMYNFWWKTKQAKCECELQWQGSNLDTPPPHPPFTYSSSTVQMLTTILVKKTNQTKCEFWLQWQRNKILPFGHTTTTKKAKDKVVWPQYETLPVVHIVLILSFLPILRNSWHDDDVGATN